MIENIRKFKGLIIVGIALVVFALVIGIKDDLFRGQATGQPILKIDGRTYTNKELSTLGSSALQLAGGLAQQGDFSIYQFLMNVSGTTPASNQDEAVENFFIGRMLIRHAKETYGLHPGNEEISEFIRGLRSFSTPEGEYDEARFRNFVERVLGRFGMTEDDFRELASDIIVSQKLNEIVGANLEPNREVAGFNMALQNQKVAVNLARLDIDPFKTDLNPTDKEIEEYWELIQDKFQTEPLRKFSYLIATPNMPDDLVEEEETIADAAATDEEKQKKAEERAAKAAEIDEKRRTTQIELDKQFDDFTYLLEEQKGEGFAELAKEYGWEVKTTELISRSAPPADLDTNLRGSSRGGKAIDELFSMNVTIDPISKISQPIAIGENQWLVAILEGEEKARTKTFDEAKAEARAQFIDEKAAEAMKAAAEEAVTKIKAALAEGKSFAEAAKDAGIENTTEVPEVSSSHRPDPATEPRTLFEDVRLTDSGEIADPIIEADRAFIAQVVSREVVKEENADERLDFAVTRETNANQQMAFNDWIAARTEAANVQRLYKPN